MSQVRRRLYLECTTTYRYDYHTGIPRVVRNVIRRLGPMAAERGYDVVPVYFSGGNLYPALLTPEGALSSLPKPLGARVRDLGRDGIRRIGRALPPGRPRDWLLAPSFEPGLARIVRNLAGTRPASAPAGDTLPPSGGISVGPGDMLLLIDVSLEIPMGDKLAQLRRAGVSIGALIYDLIPLQNPQWWPAGFPAAFQTWLEPVLQHADRLIAISSSVADDLRAHLATRPRAPGSRGPEISWFHLGHDLDPIAHGSPIRPQLREMFGSGPPVLLNVGWLDPRKNQLVLLDAFSQLLATQTPARLMLVGKRGVGGGPILERLERDAALARHVIVMNDLSDAELDLCFRESRALVYPSLSEGFGLPLVEALSRGLPAFVSDIPVFRELADDFAVFFDPRNPSALARLLDDFLRHGRYEARRPLAEFTWPTWEQCVRDLMDRVLSPLPGAA